MTQAMQSKMHAAAIDEFGGPITPHTLPVPKPGPDELLIRVEAAGVQCSTDPIHSERAECPAMSRYREVETPPGEDR